MVSLLGLQSSLVSKIDERKSSAYIMELGEDGTPTGQNLRFQYFPETIQDTKAVNWNPRDIPGGSLPIYQWVSSGARALSFTAWFTTDMDLATGGSELFDRLKQASQGHRNVDIRAAVTWLRAFMLPRYTVESPIGVPVAQAPRQMMLIFPNGGLGAAGGLGASRNDQVDEIHCIMTQCDIAYEAFFPSGLPRIASVSLAFEQSAQYAETGSVVFPEADQMNEYVKGGTYTYGYNLTVEPGKAKTTDAVAAEQGQGDDGL